MFDKISNIIRFVFLIGWIPAIIIFSPLFVIVLMAAKASKQEIKETIYSIMFLK